MKNTYLIALLASACTLGVDGETVEKTARFEGVPESLTLEFENADQDISVRGDAEQTFVEAVAGLGMLVGGDGDRAELEAVELLLREERDGTLKLALSDDAPEGISLEYLDVTTPSTVQLNLTLDTADIFVSGMAAGVTADTDTGDLDVRTTGPVNLDSDTGDIITIASGGEATTDTGDVNATVLAEGRGSFIAESDTGDITIVVPAGVGLTFDLSTDTGEIRIVTSALTVANEDGEFRGTVNGGGFLIRASTDTGDIDIVEGR